MEQRERDESSSKLEEALRELTGAETTGKIEEYENEREGADVDSETACTDMRRAETNAGLETGRRCQKI